MNSLPDIIEQCKKGKREAQSQLYTLYATKLYTLSLRYTNDSAEAEDCLHEAFMILFDKIGQYSGKGSFEGWIKRITINIALEKYRKRQRMHVVEDISKYERISTDDDTIKQMSANELLEIIKELPPRYKMVFNLYAIEGFTHKEIGEMLQIDEGTSKSNLSRARTILQNKIEKINFLSSSETYVRQRK